MRSAADVARDRLLAWQEQLLRDGVPLTDLDVVEVGVLPADPFGDQDGDA